MQRPVKNITRVSYLYREILVNEDITNNVMAFQQLQRTVGLTNALRPFVQRGDDQKDGNDISESQIFEILTIALGDTARAQSMTKCFLKRWGQHVSNGTIAFDLFEKEFTRMQVFIAFKNLSESFNQADTNHDGELDQNELQTMLNPFLGELAKMLPFPLACCVVLFCHKALWLCARTRLYGSCF